MARQSSGARGETPLSRCDNAVAIDIVDVDGQGQGGLVCGGDHFGPDGSSASLRVGALSGSRRRITLFGRSTSRISRRTGPAPVLAL